MRHRGDDLQRSGLCADGFQRLQAAAGFAHVPLIPEIAADGDHLERGGIAGGDRTAFGLRFDHGLGLYDLERDGFGICAAGGVPDFAAVLAAVMRH